MRLNFFGHLIPLINASALALRIVQAVSSIFASSVRIRAFRRNWFTSIRNRSWGLCASCASLLIRSASRPRTKINSCQIVVVGIELRRAIAYFRRKIDRPVAIIMRTFFHESTCRIERPGWNSSPRRERRSITAKSQRRLRHLSLHRCARDVLFRMSIRN